MKILKEEFLVTDEELISTHEVDEENDYEEVTDDTSSDDYESQEKMIGLHSTGLKKLKFSLLLMNLRPEVRRT